MEWIEALQVFQQRTLAMFEAAVKLAQAQAAVMETAVEVWRRGLAEIEMQQSLLRALMPR